MARIYCEARKWVHFQLDFRQIFPIFSSNPPENGLHFLASRYDSPNPTGSWADLPSTSRSCADRPFPGPNDGDAELGQMYLDFRSGKVFTFSHALVYRKSGVRSVKAVGLLGKAGFAYARGVRCHLPG